MLSIGDTAPHFALPDIDGEVISLEQILADKFALLVFIRHPG